MMGAVRVLRSIAIGVVHPVEYSICPWREVGASLTNPGEDIEEPFPEFTHFEHLVGCVTVQKEALAKQREIPMQEKEGD